MQKIDGLSARLIGPWPALAAPTFPPAPIVFAITPAMAARIRAIAASKPNAHRTTAHAVDQGPR